MFNSDYLIADRYRIIRPLGSGGMANVYLAYDLETDKQVAIKVLRLDLQDNSDFVRRFKREAQSAELLIHPNIVRIFDAGSFNGIQYISMEYIEGVDLKTYLNSNFPLKYEQIVNIMTQILSAVAVAHNHGIVHRDLKPKNILLDESGHIKVTDFGIATARSEFSNTQTNTILGSVHYLSPEQSRGTVSTNKSDIYSLGIILYELLMGKVPYEGETTISIALKHSQSNIPSLRKVNPEIPQSLENVVMRATAKNPDNRYYTAEDMANDLKTSLNPERINEKKIMFSNEIDDQETKAIPINEIKDQIERGVSSNSNNSSVKKNNTKKRKKKKPFFLWVLTFLTLSVIVFFLYAMFSPGKIPVPSVEGLSQDKAEQLIKNNDLSVGNVVQTTSSKVEEGKAIRTDPKEGSKVDKKTKVNIFISTGKKKNIFGSYVNAEYSRVKPKLESAGFKVSSSLVETQQYPPGIIIGQNIPFDEKVSPDDMPVIFTVSTSPKKKQDQPNSNVGGAKNNSNNEGNNGQDSGTDGNKGEGNNGQDSGTDGNKGEGNNGQDSGTDGNKGEGNNGQASRNRERSFKLQDNQLKKFKNNNLINFNELFFKKVR